MGRRRRSLIGTPKTVPTQTAEGDGPPDAVDEAQSEEASPTPEPADAPEAAPDVSEDVEAESSEGAAVEAPIPDTSWDQVTEDSEYSEADTVMEDDHVASAFAEEAVLEDASEDDADEAEEPAPQDEAEEAADGPADPAAVDYSRFGMDASAVVDEEAFDGGTGGGPPTEEVPMYQDVGGVRSAPMNVPAPPDVPGIGDRFTPPPAGRTEVGERQSSSRPSYLAEPTPAPANRVKKPDMFDSEVPVGASKRPVEGDDDADDEGAPIQIRYFVYGAAFVLVSAVVFVGYITLVPAGGGSSGTSAVDGDEVSHIRGVEVRKGIEKESPKFLGNVNEDEDETEGEEAEAEEVAPEAPVEEKEANEPAIAPVAQPAPAPVAPKPRPAPKPVAATSQLMIRANRKVLVVIDGKAVGYTPIDQEVTAGAHTVDATVPGQPTTKQSQSVDAASGSDQTVTFTF